MYNNDFYNSIFFALPLIIIRNDSGLKKMSRNKQFSEHVNFVLCFTEKIYSWRTNPFINLALKFQVHRKKIKLIFSRPKCARLIRAQFLIYLVTFWTTKRRENIFLIKILFFLFRKKLQSLNSLSTFSFVNLETRDIL